MKSLFSFCLVLCLAVASLTSAVPEIYSENGDVSEAPIYITTEQPLDEVSTEVEVSSPPTALRQTRDGVIGMIFNFFISILKGLFGVIPNLLGSDFLGNLFGMGAPDLGTSPMPAIPSVSATPPAAGVSPPAEMAPAADVKVPTAVSYRAGGKPTAAYYAYMRGEKVTIPRKYSAARPYRSGDVKGSCANYLKSGMYNDKDSFRSDLMGKFCVRVISSRRH